MKTKGNPRRPILCRSVLESLSRLAATTPASDETESGLRYIRALVAHESRPETIARAMRERDQVVESLREMVAIVRCIGGSFALRGEYGWDKHDEAKLDKAEATLASIGGAGHE